MEIEFVVSVVVIVMFVVVVFWTDPTRPRRQVRRERSRWAHETAVVEIDADPGPHLPR